MILYPHLVEIDRRRKKWEYDGEVISGIVNYHRIKSGGLQDKAPRLAD